LACGPLSEGCLHGDQIICPWHGSAFDVRTGRVVHGPAKIDLRTFEAAARDGKIYVRVPSAVAAGERQTA
jgi:nitrite reductase/ring-hydroxylating ferredoxin subunit